MDDPYHLTLSELNAKYANTKQTIPEWDILFFGKARVTTDLNTKIPVENAQYFWITKDLPFGDFRTHELKTYYIQQRSRYAPSASSPMYQSMVKQMKNIESQIKISNGPTSVQMVCVAATAAKGDHKTQTHIHSTAMPQCSRCGLPIDRQQLYAVNDTHCSCMAGEGRSSRLTAGESTRANRGTNEDDNITRSMAVLSFSDNEKRRPGTISLGSVGTGIVDTPSIVLSGIDTATHPASIIPTALEPVTRTKPELYPNMSLAAKPVRKFVSTRNRFSSLRHEPADHPSSLHTSKHVSCGACNRTYLREESKSGCPSCHTDEDGIPIGIGYVAVPFSNVSYALEDASHLNRDDLPIIVFVGKRAHKIYYNTVDELVQIPCDPSITMNMISKQNKPITIPH